MNGLSDAIAAHVAAHGCETRVPQSALDAAKLVLLDAYGVMLGASGMADEPRAFVRIAEAAGPGPATIIGTRRTASAAMAALAGGAMAHALDFEDAFDLAPGHPNASLVPALIALAQAEGPIDGRRFLTALAVGGDLSCRLALALRRPMEAGGWYPPPMVAAYGATAGSACLLGLTETQVLDALSLTMCQATVPGEIKYSARTTLRAVREAFPAQAAVTSALLAKEGVAGFETPFEGKAGFYALYAGGDFDPATLTDGLGKQFWIEQLTFKRWPSCRGTHPFIELASILRNANTFELSDIVRIEVRIDDVQVMLVEPADRKSAPVTAIDAKFSIPFCIALALSRGDVGLDDFGPDALASDELIALAQKVEAVVAPSATWHRGSGGGLSILLADGRTIAAEVDNAAGCPARPLGTSALVEKFVMCAVRAERGIGADQATALADAILSLEQCTDVGALLA